MTAAAVATSTGNVKRIVAAFEFARLRRELEHRRQRLEEWFTTTAVVPATPSATPSPSLNSPASSTTPSTPTSTTPTSIDATTLCSPTIAAAPTSTPEPMVPGAEDGLLTTTPTKCSTHCLNHDSKSRYIITMFPASPMVVAIDVYVAQLRVGDMPNQSEGTFRTLPAIVLDKVPWPPPLMHSHSAVTDRFLWYWGVWQLPRGSQTHVWLRSPWLPLWPIEQLRQPWPPPMTLEFLSTTCLLGCFSEGASYVSTLVSKDLVSVCGLRSKVTITYDGELRPSPWPSFTYHTAERVKCREYGVQLQQLRIPWPPKALVCLVGNELNQAILMHFQISWLLMLSYSVDVYQPYQGTILFEVEAFKLCYRGFLEIHAHCITWMLQCDTCKNSKHKLYVPCIQWSIIWPPLALVSCSREELAVMTIFRNAQLSFQCYPGAVCSYVSNVVCHRLSIISWKGFACISLNSTREILLADQGVFSIGYLLTASGNSAMHMSVTFSELFSHIYSMLWCFHDSGVLDTVKQLIADRARAAALQSLFVKSWMLWGTHWLSFTYHTIVPGSGTAPSNWNCGDQVLKISGKTSDGITMNNLLCSALFRHKNWTSSGLLEKMKYVQSECKWRNFGDGWLNILGCSLSANGEIKAECFQVMGYVLLKLFSMNHIPPLAGNPMIVTESWVQGHTSPPESVSSLVSKPEASTSRRSRQRNIFDLLAQREVSPRTKHQAKNQWTKAPRCDAGSIKLNFWVTDAQHDLFSWAEWQSLHCWCAISLLKTLVAINVKAGDMSITTLSCFWALLFLLGNIGRTDRIILTCTGPPIGARLIYAPSSGWLQMYCNIHTPLRQHAILVLLSTWPLSRRTEISLGFFRQKEELLLSTFTLQSRSTLEALHVNNSRTSGWAMISGEVVLFMKRGVPSMSCTILWDLRYSFSLDGKLPPAALHSQIIQLKRSGVDPGDIHMCSGSYMVLILHIFRDFTDIVSVDPSSQCAFSALQEKHPGCMHVIMESKYETKTLLSGFNAGKFCTTDVANSRNFLCVVTVMIISYQSFQLFHYLKCVLLRITQFYHQVVEDP